RWRRPRGRPRMERGSHAYEHGGGRDEMAGVAGGEIAGIGGKNSGGTGGLKRTGKLRGRGLGSIGALEMIFDLEEKFGIQIPYNANRSEQEFTTIGDVVTVIERLVAQKS